MKRITSILLAICIGLGLLGIGAIPIGATNAVPSGFTPICTPQDLDAVRNNLEGKYILMNDIDMASWGNWDPIGTDKWEAWYEDDDGWKWCHPCFTGIFDGNNYAIKNLTCINELGDAGLFAAVKEPGIVKNLRLVNVTIKSTGAAGGVAGNAICGAAILNCSVSGSVTATNSSAGGIAGSVVSGDTKGGARIRSCHNDARITSTCRSAGGIIGGSSGGSDMVYANAVDAVISRCSNSGKITSAVRAGGIQGGGSTTIINCYNTGTIIGSGCGATSTFLGGISGYSCGGSVVGGCYNTGNIMGNQCNPNTAMHIGAIIGSDARTVNANYGTSTDLTACYYLRGLSVVGLLTSRDDMTGEPYAPVYTDVRALSILQMKQQHSFRGFDFENAWELKCGRYPTLRVDTSGALTDPMPVVPPAPDPFWVDLPDWQQWILRWLCFGWLWMR